MRRPRFGVLDLGWVLAGTSPHGSIGGDRSIVDHPGGGHGQASRVLQRLAGFRGWLGRRFGFAEHDARGAAAGDTCLASAVCSGFSTISLAGNGLGRHGHACRVLQPLRGRLRPGVGFGGRATPWEVRSATCGSTVIALGWSTIGRGGMAHRRLCRVLPLSASVPYVGLVPILRGGVGWVGVGWPTSSRGGITRREPRTLLDRAET